MSAFTFTAKRGFSLLGDEKGAWMAGTTAETLVGSELLTDGNMTVLTGWTLLAGTGGGSIVSSAGAMLFTQGGTSKPMHAYQGFTVVSGQSYLIDVTNLTGTVANLKVGVGTAVPVADTAFSGTYVTKTLVANDNVFITFNATASGTVYYVISDEQASAATSTWDNATGRLADPDFSSNTNGLAVFGSITKAAVATGADMVGYSGFSASNYLEQPYNADFDSGTGELRIRFWLKEAANSATETIYDRDTTSSLQRVTVEINSAGNIVFTCDDNTTTRAVTSTGAVDDGVWRYVECSYSAGTLSLYINGALDNTVTGAALLTLTNTSAVIRWGYSVAGANPLTNGTIALPGGSLVASTAAQIRAVYDKEKHLIKKYSYYTREGRSYSLDISLQSAPHSTRTFRVDNVSLDRSVTESIIYGDDNEYNIMTGKMHRTDNTYTRISEFNEFIYATRGSETFTVDFYGTVATADEPKTAIRTDNNITEVMDGPFWRSASFKVKEL